ncbi:response regulator [Natrialbaceae archaeon A-arb3/5]
MAEDDGTVECPIDILLVEPNPGDTRLFTESFVEAKLTNSFYTVSNGTDALDFVHQRGEFSEMPRPDLILLEPKLPGTDGLDVLSELNNEPSLHDIPTVVFTSSETGEDIVKSHGIDADHYLRKPVESEEFLEFVRSVESFWLTITERTSSDPCSNL